MQSSYQVVKAVIDLCVFIHTHIYLYFGGLCPADFVSFLSGLGSFEWSASFFFGNHIAKSMSNRWKSSENHDKMI